MGGYIGHIGGASKEYSRTLVQGSYITGIPIFTLARAGGDSLRGRD